MSEFSLIYAYFREIGKEGFWQAVVIIFKHSCCTLNIVSLVERRSRGTDVGDAKKQKKEKYIL